MHVCMGERDRAREIDEMILHDIGNMEISANGLE